MQLSHADLGLYGGSFPPEVGKWLNITLCRVWGNRGVGLRILNGGKMEENDYLTFWPFCHHVNSSHELDLTRFYIAVSGCDSLKLRFKKRF